MLLMTIIVINCSYRGKPSVKQLITCSGSTRFHEYNSLSFLDGEYSIDAYNICEGRRAPNTYKKKKRMVYVSGFKRTIKYALSRPSDVLGIIFKESDGIDSLLETIERLPANIKRVEIRLHPATSQTTLNELSRR